MVRRKRRGNRSNLAMWKEYADLFEFFDDYGVDYRTSGVNVGSGWVGIRCLYCDDDSYHMGINLSTFKVYCWICGYHKLTHVIGKIAKCPMEKARVLSDHFEFKSLEERYKEFGGIRGRIEYEQNKNEYKTVIPPEATRRFPQAHLDYLRSRGFAPLRTVRKYKLWAVDGIGKYMFRIIFPVYENNKIVNFTARDITGKQKPKYLIASNLEAIRRKGECLFNFNSVHAGGDAILVEGPIDVMKMGDGAFCPMGLETSPKQAKMIKDRNIRRLFIIRDRGVAGRKMAFFLSNLLAPIVRELEVIKLENTKAKDPGELTFEEAEVIKKIINFNR